MNIVISRQECHGVWYSSSRGNGHIAYSKGNGCNLNLGSTRFGKQDDYSTLPYYKIIRHNISN